MYLVTAGAISTTSGIEFCVLVVFYVAVWVTEVTLLPHHTQTQNEMHTLA